MISSCVVETRACNEIENDHRSQGAAQNNKYIYKSLIRFALFHFYLKSWKKHTQTELHIIEIPKKKYIANRADGQSVHLTVNEFELMIRKTKKPR